MFVGVSDLPCCFPRTEKIKRTRAHSYPQRDTANANRNNAGYHADRMDANTRIMAAETLEPFRRKLPSRANSIRVDLDSRRGRNEPTSCQSSV